MEILDAEGLDAVSMRAVAQRLSTGPASLYAHVANKDELMERILDRVMGEMVVPDPDPERWFEQTMDLGRMIRRVYASHRDLARTAFARIPTNENALILSERACAVMKAGGLSDRAVAWAMDVLSLYATASAYEKGIQRADEDADPGALQDYIKNISRFFTQLPASRYPVMAALAPALLTGDDDERYDFGLEALLLGIVETDKRWKAAEK
jgi:AcrR family transcriptional regulator